VVGETCRHICLLDFEALVLGNRAPQIDIHFIFLLTSKDPRVKNRGKTRKA